MSQPLAPLRDVEGVAGSFVVNGAGAVLARDLPAVFDEEVFAEVGPRLERLFEALAADGPAVKWSALRFSEHKLLVRPIQDAYLCVLASGSASLPALRVAANLTAKRLGTLAPPPPSSDPPPTLRSERIPPALPAVARTDAASHELSATQPSLHSPIAEPADTTGPTHSVTAAPPSDDTTNKRYRIFRGRRYEV